MGVLDFEVHIGLSKTADSPDVASIPAIWKRDPVINLISLKGAHEYEEHNVEGKLRTLLTRHARSIHDVQNHVTEAADYCRHEPSSRVEVEQVLVACGEDLAIPEVEEFNFVPTSGAFPRLKLIEETPPYEVHYCLAARRGAALPSVADVAALCADAAIGIDEIVEFGGDAKITTTKFYKSLRTMAGELESDAAAFLAAMRRAGADLRFRLIAERIITCGIPL